MPAGAPRWRMIPYPPLRLMLRLLDLRLLLFLLLVLGRDEPSVASAERRLTIFYTGGVRGTLEPCGCTSDPLGDVSRMAALVRQAQRGAAVLVVDAGNLSYPIGDIPPRRRDAVDLRARFLATELPRLPFAGSGLGENDLNGGPDKVQARRLAANLDPALPVVAPSRLQKVGTIQVGVFGIVDPAVARTQGWKAEDPLSAARREAESLRRRGAEVVVAVAPLPRGIARQIARGADVDLVVFSDRELEDGMAEPAREGKAFLVSPGVELQKLGRLDLVIRPARPGTPRLVDGGGVEARRSRREQIDRAITSLDGQLAAWQKEAGADPAFVAAKKKERDELAAERSRLQGEWQPPAEGSYFIHRLIPLRRVLPRDPALATAMRALDRAVGAANLRHAEPPPPAPPGRAAFVGDRACVRCHERQMAQWRTTVHATAWHTLVAGGKTGDDECVSCHVTGYGEVGGSSFGFTRKLESVQCETCHGPGSLHVAKEGLEEPPAVRRQVTASTCKHCHTEKHSDTFQYEAYLRDVLGAGHGARSRERLGPGPTGHELRSAALARAKAAGEAEKKRL
jgi:hypothetical protein